MKIRVQEGGHTLEPDVIERRYLKGIKNLFDIFLLEIDGLLIFDNSCLDPTLVSKKGNNGELEILDKTKFKQIRKQYDSYR